MADVAAELVAAAILAQRRRERRRGSRVEIRQPRPGGRCLADVPDHVIIHEVVPHMGEIELPFGEGLTGPAADRDPAMTRIDALGAPAASEDRGAVPRNRR